MSDYFGKPRNYIISNTDYVLNRELSNGATSDIFYSESKGCILKLIKLVGRDATEAQELMKLEENAYCYASQSDDLRPFLLDFYIFKKGANQSH